MDSRWEELLAIQVVPLRDGLDHFAQRGWGCQLTGHQLHDDGVESSHHSHDPWNILKDRRYSQGR